MEDQWLLADIRGAEKRMKGGRQSWTKEEGDEGWDEWGEQQPVVQILEKRSRRSGYEGTEVGVLRAVFVAPHMGVEAFAGAAGSAAR